MTSICSILIFAKAPRAGAVKTRLIPALGEEGATDLYRSMLRYTIVEACRADIGPVELWCAPDTHDTFFLRAARQFDLTLHAQQGQNLGEKMAHALNDALLRAPRALLIGSDCPLLDAAYLRQAASVLEGKNNIVISPTDDGGYALIGAANQAPNIFNDIDWSTPHVMAQTRERLRILRAAFIELAQVWDVDVPADLDRLRSRPAFAEWLAAPEAI